MIPKTSVFSERYNRQTLLPEIGLKGQERLAQSRVLIVGMGGLGCPAALYLAGAGVGHLGIVDDDRVDLSNLQRQILYKNAECGMLKVEAAQIRLLELNPEIHVTAYATRVTASNISSIFSKYDLVIDGTDNFSSKFLMNDAAVQLEIPLVYGSISRFEGHVSVFWSKHGPCYRCLYPEPPKTHIRNCEESGVLGALAGMIGSAQALEAI
ncbi:MAG: HesA/MoeB/ThiF family protein, partial [Bdellovibrionota bacterium]